MGPPPDVGRCITCGEPRWPSYGYCPRCGTGYAGWPSPRAAGFGPPRPDQSGSKTSGLVIGCVVVVLAIIAIYVIMFITMFGGLDQALRWLSSPDPYSLPFPSGFPYPSGFPFPSR